MDSLTSRIIDMLYEVYSIAMKHGAPEATINKHDEKFVGALKAFLSHLPKQTQDLVVLHESGNPAAASESREPVVASEDDDPAATPGDSEPVIASEDENPAAASGGNEPVVASEDDNPAAASGEQAATSQPAADTGRSDNSATQDLQFNRQNEKVQALFDSLADWTKDPLSFFHGNTLNIEKDLLSSIDKYIGGLLNKKSDFDSVRMRILQVTYHRVKDEVLEKKRLRGDAKEEMINTLQQGGLNAITSNHKPLQWVDRGSRLVDICKDMGHKTKSDYCYTANLFLLDDISDTELQRLPLNGNRRDEFIASIKNRDKLSDEDKETLEKFSEKVMDTIWTHFQQSIKQNGVFVNSQIMAQDGSPARADMSNQLLNRLDDTNLLVTEADTPEVGHNATHADVEAHMLNVANDDEETGTTGVTNRRADGYVQTPTPPSSACSSTSESPPSSDIEGQFAEHRTSTLTSVASLFGSDTTNANDRVTSARDIYPNSPIGNQYAQQSIIGQSPLPFYPNTRGENSASSPSWIMRARSSSTMVNRDTENRDGCPFAESLPRSNEWPDLDADPLPLAEPGQIIASQSIPNSLQYGSSPSRFWDQAQLDQPMAEVFDPLGSSALFSVFPNPTQFEPLSSDRATQMDQPMTEGFDPLESSALFSVFPNPTQFEPLSSDRATQMDQPMTEGFDPLESSALFSVFPNPTQFEPLSSDRATQMDQPMTEGFDPLESSALFSVFPNPTQFEPLSSDRATQMDQPMTEGFDPLESSALFSVFPNPIDALSNVSFDDMARCTTEFNISGPLDGNSIHSTH
ncbi:hypothetical protein N7478_003785 [Penicillium angulare]|uniref:uncharacterized protein n=1 Tax=Penicillium angulare TaxID=116970 RepID=UPI002541861D|nr:uncharacterized protein N7478_003785 [Penicillium angulare]KAJ5288099.1 hypothetical protein N7478_003785 [Penicillium angulare]